MQLLANRRGLGHGHGRSRLEVLRVGARVADAPDAGHGADGPQEIGEQRPDAPVSVAGQKPVTWRGERIAVEVQRIVDDYVRATYGGEPRAAHLDPDRKSISIKAHA